MSTLAPNPRVGIGAGLVLCKRDVRPDDVGKRADVASQNLPQHCKKSGTGTGIAYAAPSALPSMCAFEESERPVERVYEQGRQSECMQAIDQIATSPGQAHDSRGQEDGHDLQTHERRLLNPAQVDR